MKSNRMIELQPGLISIRPSSIASVDVCYDWPSDLPYIRVCMHGGQQFYAQRQYAEFMALINMLEGV